MVVARHRMHGTTRVLAVAGFVWLLGSTTATAEVNDCIEIVTLPAVITQTGVHCFKQDLSSTATSGNAITINANNVIIEMNGFKLGGLGAGPATLARGIFAEDRKNVTIRNGSIRGFFNNIMLDQAVEGASGGHLIEKMRIEGARSTGIIVEGAFSVIRDNFVFATGNRPVVANATGISVSAGKGHSITGNVVSGVTEEGISTGITAGGTSATLVRGNVVRDIVGNAGIGIRFTGGPANVIVGNSVINTTTESTGILADGSADGCIDNLVTGFTTALFGCAFAADNRTY